MAARYFINGGTNNNWGNTTNWSTTSGGAGGSSIPTSADDVYFDANSPNCTIDTSARAALTLTCTNYTNTLTFSQQLTVTGNVTLGSGMSFSGASELLISGTSTITPNTKSIDVPLTFSSASNATITLAADVTVTKNFTKTNASNTFTGNLYCGASVRLFGRLTGGTLIMNGTGTIRSGFYEIFACNIVFNTTGTITIDTDITIAAGTITYTAGTIVATGSLVRFKEGTTVTLNCSGMVWNNLIFYIEYPLTNKNISLSSDLRVANEIHVDGTITFTGAGTTIYCSGTLTCPNPYGGAIAGLKTIVFDGTGSIKIFNFWCNLTINTTGTITFIKTIYNEGTLTYTAGTVITTNSSLEFYNPGVVALATSGITWDVLFATVGYPQTSKSIVLTENLNVSGSLLGYGGATVIFSGAGDVYLSGSVLQTGPWGGSYWSGKTIYLIGTGILTSTNGNLTAGGVGANLVFNTTGTITIQNNFSLGDGGTITYIAGTVVTTNSTLRIDSLNSTLNCSAITWNNVSIARDFTTGTTTLAANLNVSGTFSLSTGSQHNISGTATITCANMTITHTGNCIFNSGISVTCSGGIAITSTGTFSGAGVIRLNGSGTISNSSTGRIQSNLTINTSGTITFSGTVYYDTGTLTYTAGTVITTGSTLNLTNANTTLNCAGIRWNNITFGPRTHTLQGDLISDGTINTGNGNSSLTINGAYKVIVNGNFIGSIANGNTIGTAAFHFTGTGTITQSGLGVLSTTTVFNTSGTITIISLFVIGTSLTYTAGTIVTTGSTLLISTVTLNCASIRWNNISFTTSITSTTTLLGDLISDGTISIPNVTNGTVIVNGSGFKLIANGNWTGPTTNCGVVGDAAIYFTGTGTFSQTGSGTISNNVTIDTTGVLTITGTLNYLTNTITITTNSIITGTGTIAFTGTGTMNANGASIPKLTINNNVIVNLASNLGITSGITSNYSGTNPILKSSINGTRRKLILGPSVNYNTLNLNVTDIDSSDGAPGFTVNGTISNCLNWYQALPLKTHGGPRGSLTSSRMG